MIRLFRVFVPTSVLMLLLSETILIFSCFVVAAYFVLDIDPEIFLLYEGGLMRVALVVGSVLLGLYFQDLYTNIRVRTKTLLLQQLCLVIGIVFFFQAFLTYLNSSLMMPRWLMIYGCGAVLVLLPAWRTMYSNVVLKGVGADRVLFLGTNAIAQEIAEKLQAHPELGLVPLGFLDDCEPPRDQLAGVPMMGSAAELRGIVGRLRPERIIVGMTERRQRMPMADLLELRFAGTHIEEAATAYETTFGRVSTSELRPSQLIFSGELGPQPRNLSLQNFYSWGLAAIGLVVSAPIMVIVALLVKLTSRGPVLFRQTRVGQNGVTFQVYKFRSMTADAEARTGAVWATRNDPRVTPIGRYLRTLRLDELPQLFNVLRGEMSIVGPRPERPEFVRTLSEQIPFYPQRHCVKPGLTGWAQINYKYGETFQDAVIKLEYDLYYIKNLSLSLDMYILFHTLKVMLFSRSGQ